jgi:arylsulfatase A
MRASMSLAWQTQRAGSARPAAALACVLLLAACAVAEPVARPAAATPASASRPPNIVFIMADDLGYGDIGAFGQTRIQTPRLDEMAREGTVFTDFYAGSTVCAPSRSALMTGQHTGNTPIRGNHELPEGQQPLPSGTLTLSRLLKDAGYATGLFGKWGLGGEGSEGIPTRQGFDEFYGYLNQRRAHFYYPEFLYRGEQREPLPGNRVRPPPQTWSFQDEGAGWPLERGTYGHDAIVDEALDFLNRHRDRPFFLYLAVLIPHAELQVPDDALEPYLDAEGSSIFPEVPFPGNRYSPQPMPRATHAAMVTRLDRDVGRILDRLRELGVAEHTLVFFTSDNGAHREGGHDPDFFASNGILRGHKRDLYEGGIRVPMIAWGPGRIPAGQRSAQVWALWDVLPTAADFAGLPVPAGIDGISMRNALTGHGPQEQHEYLYWELYERGSAQAARMGRWKAVRAPMFTGDIELYDLHSDPAEEHDVAAQHPELVRRFEAILRNAHIPSPLWSPPAPP